MVKKVLFEPFPKQEEFIVSVMSGDYVFVFYGGSIRGGKTMAILGLFIMLCWYFPGSKFIVCRKDIEILKATTLKTFNEIYPRSITEKTPSAHNGWEWVCTNGSVIKFFSENIARDPELFRFRGLEYDSIAFDEMDVTEATFWKSFERLGTWKMRERKEALERGEPIPPRVVVGTSNPQEGWVKRDIHDPFIEGNLPKDWHYILSKVYDNDKIDPDWIEQQRSTMLPDDFLRFVEGDWTVDKNKVRYFKYYKDNIHYSREFQFDFDHNAETWLAFDFNYDPTTCTVFQVLDDCVLAMRCYGITGGTRALCKLMKQDPELMAVPKLLWTITGDSSGNSKSSTAGDVTDYDIIQEEFNIGDQFLRVNTRNKAHVYSRRLCDTFLFKVPFAIDYRCSQLRNDLLKAKPVEGTEDLYKDRKKGFEMDYIDNFRYFVDAKFFGGIDDVNRFAELCKIRQQRIA